MELIRGGRPAGAAVALVLLAVAAAGCASGSGADVVTPETLLASIAAGTAPVVVDVRTRLEYDEGHVPGALHIPLSRLLVSADDLAVSRERTVIVYCEHGARAGIAGSTLRRAGFTDVRSLDGHMSGWKARGLPLER